MSEEAETLKQILKRQRGFHLGPYKGISDVFDNDPWFRSFYMEIAALYGLPVSQKHAYTKQEKILSAFASINISIVLEQSIKVWHPWWKEKREITPELAEEFCRGYYERTGEQVVPLM